MGEDSLDLKRNLASIYSQQERLKAAESLFHKLDRVVRTPSSEQVRRPINRDGMEI